ncbi:MAG: Holliday junction resolvase RuvX [Deltaproteobacteria bacterium]|nr:Holliday junction resolvase RuvX [Deltaproteobacteria bacterium]
MRILGIDYGAKRVGVAVSDEMEWTARALKTIDRMSRRAVAEEIVRMAGELSVEEIVIGYPLRLDGSMGIQCLKVDRFIEILSSMTHLPIKRWDETLSTKEAEERMREQGLSPRKRREWVDRMAASIILQSYLDYVEMKKIRGEHD